MIVTVKIEIEIDDYVVELPNDFDPDTDNEFSIDINKKVEVDIDLDDIEDEIVEYISDNIGMLSDSNIKILKETVNEYYDTGHGYEDYDDVIVIRKSNLSLADIMKIEYLLENIKKVNHLELCSFIDSK
jgi:hypothetical protein